MLKNTITNQKIVQVFENTTPFTCFKKMQLYALVFIKNQITFDIG